MSEITMKTIESLPIVEEPAEGASLVGWNNGQTVRMPVDKIGGGTKGIVFTMTWEESELSPASVEPLSAYNGYRVSCNYPFEEFLELFQAGAPMMLVNEYDQEVSSMAQGYWGVGGGEVSSVTLSFIDPSASNAYAYISFKTFNGIFNIEYNAEGIYIYQDGGDA